jgi:Cellulose binding domain/Fibronectin type III domain
MELTNTHLLRAGRGRRFALAGAALLLTTGTLTVSNLPSAHAADAVSVTVNAKSGMATVSPLALGINHAIWDPTLGTNETSDLLKAAGIKMLRYPGGSYGDIYKWETHTAPGGFVAENTDFDTFMSAVRRVGAQPMIIANYGTGTPEEAAGWVRSANIDKGYGAKYWIIGNENYGNGHYGANWEADNHDDKSPAGYANLVVQFADAMKAVDPSVKIGAVLTMPANWPDGLTGGGDAGTWNKTVLSIAGPKIDFVDVHWYPGGSSPADSLTKSAQIDDAMFVLRQQIAAYAGANSQRLGISLTETSVGAGPNSTTGALYLADIYSSLLANGIFTVQWWNVHNGMGEVKTIEGETDFGDFGILSSGQCTSDNSVCQPPHNTPFAPYYGLSLINSFARPGDQFIRAATDQPMVAAYAARRPNGDVAVLLINKDPNNSYPVSINYSGFSPAGSAPTVYTFTKGATSVTTSTSGSATSQTLAPYSLTAVVVRPSRAPANAPSAPGQPSASAITDTTATISWPASSAGGNPISKYELYRQNGAISEQLGETSGTSLTVHNLVPGSRYTVSVITRDTAGNVSWSSPPLTFATGAPTSSSCKVKFTDNATDWGNGYVASVDIINNGPGAIDGWTLDYKWPTVWQRMDGGWNANWSQVGTAVKATSLPENRKLAAGASVNIGFVAAYNGPNILPTAFTLNGTLCTN